MGKRQEAALETKRRLTAAVNELLREKSLNDISIEEITTKAGVAKGSFYTYFRRKEDAACCAAFDKYEAVRQESLKESDGVYLNLCTYLNGSAAIIEKHTLPMAQGWMRAVTSPLEGERRGVEKYAFDSENLQKLLQNAVRRGELRPDTPVQELGALIMDAYYGAVAVWCITGGEFGLTDGMACFCEYGLGAMIDQYRSGGNGQ